MLLSFLILLPLSGILVLIMLEPALIRPSQNDIYPKYTKTPFLSDPHNLEDEEIINLNNWKQDALNGLDHNLPQDENFWFRFHADLEKGNPREGTLNYNVWVSLLKNEEILLTVRDIDRRIEAIKKINNKKNKTLKVTALTFTVVELFISLLIWFLFDNSSMYFQFVQEHHTVSHFDFYLGLDGMSIYFVLLTTLIGPVSIISNWKSINLRTAYFLVIILLLESALLLIYTVLDILMFYIFFESILAPLFILIGFFGSTDKLRASFYFFLYTFLGSLFMLLSIITVSVLIGCTDMSIIYKTDYAYMTQVFLFLGVLVAFAVKTPVIFLNTWLLKAHVESPLSGSVILAAIVLKLSLYGVFRLILPLVPKAYIFYTHMVFVICVITILYASFSTIRTIDVKELIAYSSVSHAAVYLAGIFSNVIQGIQGGILLGLAHGFVSSGLFISGGGVLYDRSGTRTINYYGGLAQIMPIFSILFFILCLGNCGAPLTLNFVGEFMSLYGIFERLSFAGILASSSIILSAVYTIFMFNRIIFGGMFKGWFTYLSDINRREYSLLFVLVIFIVLLGIYPSIIIDGLNYYVSELLYCIDFAHVYCMDNLPCLICGEVNNCQCNNNWENHVDNMINNPGLSGVSADGNTTWSISHPPRVGPPMPDHEGTVTRTYTSCEVDMTPAEIAQQEAIVKQQLEAIAQQEAISQHEIEAIAQQENAQQAAHNANAVAAQFEAVVTDSSQNEQSESKGEKEEK